MSTFDDLKQDLDKVLDEIGQSPVWGSSPQVRGAPARSHIRGHVGV